MTSVFNEEFDDIALWAENGWAMQYCPSCHGCTLEPPRAGCGSEGSHVFDPVNRFTNSGNRCGVCGSGTRYKATVGTRICCRWGCKAILHADGVWRKSSPTPVDAVQFPTNPGDGQDEEQLQDERGENQVHFEHPF